MSNAVRLSFQIIEALRDRLHANLAYTRAVIAESQFIVRDAHRCHQQLHEVRLRSRPLEARNYLPPRRRS